MALGAIEMNVHVSEESLFSASVPLAVVVLLPRAAGDTLGGAVQLVVALSGHVGPGRPVWGSGGPHGSLRHACPTSQR